MWYRFCVVNLPDSLKDYLQQETAFVPGSLAAVAVEIVHKHQNRIPLGLGLAACFDLVVASKFYRDVKPENWLWCESCGMDFYPLLNACPSCVLDGKPVHHDGNKPGSGTIGPATSAALREILVSHYYLSGRKEMMVFNGTEPVDLALVDSGEKKIFMAEVKASPLFTPPLAIAHTPAAFQTSRAVPLRHSAGTMRNMHEHDVSLFIPKKKGEHFRLNMLRKGLGSSDWPEKAITEAIAKSPQEFLAYISSWTAMWKSYETKDDDDQIFWFTGACGLPRNPGEGWPKDSKGKAKGTISDGKTSVGLDRTDDIKKSTFQVLKLGVESRKLPLGDWGLRIGLASNLHAVRHYAEYLKPIEDVVWGLPKPKRKPKNWFNLFDGIISFSKSHTRDEWIESIVDWK